MATSYTLFAPTPRGAEAVLADELRALGARRVTPTVAGVELRGSLELAYRTVFWSRVASRVLLPLATFPAPEPDALYAGVRTVRWLDHLPRGATFAVTCTTVASAITHTGYAALKTKDAVVDQLRDETGARPNVDPHTPDLRIHLHIHDDVATVSVDLAGESLHRRGWRGGQGAAPLKENLAAAVLLLAGWPDVAAEGGGFVDPMCGSGTLLVEAAWMAADVAPGTLRERFGCEGWAHHDPALLARIRDEAKERDRRGARGLPRIVGYDGVADAVRVALENVERAGLRGVVHVERRDLGRGGPLGEQPGLVVVNPPYGERLGTAQELEVLYRRLGDVLKHDFAGWSAFVLTGNPDLAKFIGLRPRRRHVVFNGPIECRLLDIPIHAKSDDALTPDPGPRVPDGPVEDFANRLRKNAARLDRWARKNRVSCYRLYDADVPEYAIQVDRYDKWVHVTENQPPASVDRVRAVTRLNDAVEALAAVLDVPRADIFVKRRRRQKGTSQYERMAERAFVREVGEGGHRFLVNLSDYFDTGLFLDHRDVRAMLGELAEGRRFLNLFAYTGTATVYAARGGAVSTTTVDLSNTYLEWAQKNLDLNGIGGNRHQIVRADCLQWLQRQRSSYDLIFLDPPTFSNSKGMRTSFDVQADHVALIRDAMRLLSPEGVLVFSTNFRRFRIERDALSDLALEDLTRATLPHDFKRDPRIHQVWRITRG